MGSGSGASPRPKRGNPYLPTGVPRNTRDDNAKPRRSSSPNSTVRVVGVPFRSAFLGELDNNAVAEVLVPFHNRWAGWHVLGPHEALSIESVQGVLSILSDELLTQIQSVASDNTTTYATIFKLNKPKACATNGHELFSSTHRTVATSTYRS